MTHPSNRFTSPGTALAQVLLACGLIAATTVARAEALDPCAPPPVSDGEHSVGSDPGFTPEEAMAADAFCHSAAITAQMATLTRYEFSAWDATPRVTTVSNTCDAAPSACEIIMTVDSSYSHVTMGERVLQGRFVLSRFGSTEQAIFSANDLDTTGIGRPMTIDGSKARRFMDALGEAGVYDDRAVVGSQSFTVGRVECSEPVIPRPVPRCTIQFRGNVMPASDKIAKILSSTLYSINAFTGPTDIVGSVNAGADLVRCQRPVVPNAPTTCVMIADERE